MQQIETQQLLHSVEELRKAQAHGDARVQDIRTASDQKIGHMKSKILESDDDHLRTKLARMTTYLEDSVWRLVQEEIVRREYERIQSREEPAIGITQKENGRGVGPTV